MKGNIYAITTTHRKQCVQVCLSGKYLSKPSWTPIKRHILVKGNASPDNPALQDYWQKRRERLKASRMETRHVSKLLEPNAG